jgi:hypothetical protein
LLPVSTFIKPSCLNNQENGKLSGDLLVACGLGRSVMIQPAARGMLAMLAAMHDAGFIMASVGTYRTFDQQVELFNKRYTRVKLPTRPTKVWNNKTYWQKPRTAMAATPGTSNHGWGCAVDFAEYRNGKVVSITPKAVAWLVENAATYGFSAEAQSEPWHWRWNAGDKMPQAVRNHENQPTAL